MVKPHKGRGLQGRSTRPGAMGRKRKTGSGKRNRGKAARIKSLKQGPAWQQVRSQVLAAAKEFGKGFGKLELGKWKSPTGLARKLIRKGRVGAPGLKEPSNVGWVLLELEKEGKIRIPRK